MFNIFNFKVPGIFLTQTYFGYNETKKKTTKTKRRKGKLIGQNLTLN